MDDHNEIRELLRSRRDIKASDALRHKVRMAIDVERRKRQLGSRVLGWISLSAVAAVLLIAFIPSGVSAKEFLAEAIEAFGRAGNIEMVVEVRTRPVENFRYIDLNDDFVTHHIDVAISDSLLTWRVDKGGRVAMGNGNDIYTWMPDLKLGLHLDDTDTGDVLGYMANLLTPRDILESELDNCLNNKGAEYRMDKAGEDVILTVHAAAEGYFDNPYLLNSSITESENIRRYVIDATTKRLKSVEVSVVAGGREVVVLKVTEIIYGQRKDDIFRLADGIKFVETENRPVGLTGLSAEEAAGTILNAFAEWDESILDKVMLHEFSDAAYRERFSGSRLISIGRSFTSGAGNSIFVPYTLQLRDGRMQRHNIALQKTDAGGWIVVGGL